MNASIPAASGNQAADGDTPSPHSAPAGAGTTAGRAGQRAASVGDAEAADAAYDDEYEPL